MTIVSAQKVNGVVVVEMSKNALNYIQPNNVQTPIKGRLATRRERELKGFNG